MTPNLIAKARELADPAQRGRLAHPGDLLVDLADALERAEAVVSALEDWEMDDDARFREVVRAYRQAQGDKTTGSSSQDVAE